MSKSLSLVLCACFFLNSLTVFADANQTRALSIDIGGIGPGVDQKAYRQVRKLIGSGIAQGTFDKFVIHGYGKEGGFSACVQAGRFSDEKDFQRLAKTLKAVRYNKNTTAYQVTESTACQDDLSALSVSVFKSDASLQCQENSGVAIDMHQKELENKGIVVSNARKQADGLMHAAVCDSATGLRNVFDIAVTDLDEALALGFSVLVE